MITDEQGRERGSTLPFVLLCWLIAALMAVGGIAASDAFLEQQKVRSVCDGAALAGANLADETVVYASGVGTHVPLTGASTEAAVARHLSDAGVRLDAWGAATNGSQVTVRCTRYVAIAFGGVFLHGRPLERTAVASARALSRAVADSRTALDPMGSRAVGCVAGEGFEPS